MVLLTAIALIVWILVSIVPLDPRARIAVAVAIIIILLLGLLGVIHLPSRVGG